jgi:hypothetical protein
MLLFRSPEQLSSSLPARGACEEAHLFRDVGTGMISPCATAFMQLVAKCLLLAQRGHHDTPSDSGGPCVCSRRANTPSGLLP